MVLVYFGNGVPGGNCYRLKEPLDLGVGKYRVRLVDKFNF